MTKTLQNFAQVAGLTEQQAYTLAVIVRRSMKDGMTMEQAVESYMQAMDQLTAYARTEQ